MIGSPAHIEQHASTSTSTYNKYAFALTPPRTLTRGVPPQQDEERLLRSTLSAYEPCCALKQFCPSEHCRKYDTLSAASIRHNSNNIKHPITCSAQRPLQCPNYDQDRTDRRTKHPSRGRGRRCSSPCWYDRGRTRSPRLLLHDPRPTPHPPRSGLLLLFPRYPQPHPRPCRHYWQSYIAHFGTTVEAMLCADIWTVRLPQRDENNKFTIVPIYNIPL